MRSSPSRRSYSPTGTRMRATFSVRREVVGVKPYTLFLQFLSEFA